MFYFIGVCGINILLFSDDLLGVCRKQNRIKKKINNSSLFVTDAKTETSMF